MKAKFSVVILFIATIAFAQTYTQTKPVPADSPTTPAAETKPATCPCCQKMMGGKDAKGCCHHSNAKGEMAMSCCQGKEGMACKRDSKSTSADGCCSGGKCCNAKDAKGCCSKCAKAMETAMACCGSQCQMGHHNHTEANN